MATRMQQRRGTASQWTSADPILAAGEIGFEIDTNKFKIGDGINHWDDLDYFASSSELLSIVDGAPELLDTLNELAAALGDDPNFASKVVPIIKKTTQGWEADSSIIPLGTVAYNTTLLGLKVGNGINNFAGLEYMMNSAQVSAAIAASVTAAVDGILDDTTFSGDIALPSTTSIGSVTGTEISYLAGVTASIQGQIDDLEQADVNIQGELDDKANTANPTFTGTVVLPTTTSIGDVSSTEIGYVNGVTSGIQTQLDAKLASATASSTYAPLSGPTFTGTVVLPSTTSVGDVSSTELGYVNGVTSAIQTQLDAKAPTADPTFTGTVAGVTKSHVGLGNVDNTSDANKPVSTATQTALDAKASLAGATFTGDVTVETDLTIEGNLTVSGTTTTIDVTDLSVSDPLIYLASGQYAEDVLDVGFLAATGVVGGTEGSHLHSGFFRDVSDGKKWKLISNVPHPVSNVVDTTNATRETLVVGNLEATGVVFSDGTQTKAGVPSITTIAAKTDSYTLSNLNERDTIVEISKSSATTLTIPTNSSVAYPVGTTIDIIQTGTGQVTIAGAGGVTVNATPGLKLRTQWSSATLLKRAENTWLVYGDLTA
jgi:cytoskeletal protein CcmA (bactofilin family)